MYDIENRLVSASGAKNATLKYDPYGRLYEVVGAATTRFVYDGDALILERNASNAILRRYVHGRGMDRPLAWYEGTGVANTDRRDLIPDRLGSVIAVVTQSGVTRNTYDEYGVPGTGNLGAFAYTGQRILPELGLYYYKARIYDPYLGRFLQTDPIGYDDQMNLYAYVGNDPVNARDPMGLQGIREFNDVVSTPQIQEQLIAPLPDNSTDDEIAGTLEKLDYNPSGMGEVMTSLADPLGALSAKGAADRALNENRGHNDISDARRHAQWSADMTQRIGAERAKNFGDAHERSGGNAAPELLMDLINNHNGRVLGGALPDATPSEIARAAGAANLLQATPVQSAPRSVERKY